MAFIEVDTSELDNLAFELEAAANKTDERVAQIVTDTVKDIQRGARQRAPVDTGALRNSIDVRFSDGGRSGMVYVGVHYAGFVEFGTSRMAPQPYMTPAIEAALPKFQAAMENIAEDTL